MITQSFFVVLEFLDSYWPHVFVIAGALGVLAGARRVFGTRNDLAARVARLEAR